MPSSRHARENSHGEVITHAVTSADGTILAVPPGERAPARQRGGFLKDRTFELLRRGIEAAIVASVPQVLIPKLEEYLFLPDHEDADLGPRLIEALAKKVEAPLPEDIKWVAAASFHFSYAAFWGVAYALAQERLKMKPWAGGLGLSALIYLITFPPWGGAVQTGSEPPPERRTWRKEVVLATAPLVFGLGTALLYGRGPKRRSAEC